MFYCSAQSFRYRAVRAVRAVVASTVFAHAFLDELTAAAGRGGQKEGCCPSPVHARLGRAQNHRRRARRRWQADEVEEAAGAGRRLHPVPHRGAPRQTSRSQGRRISPRSCRVH